MNHESKADQGQSRSKQSRRPRPAPLHTVEVQPHALAPRWIVPHLLLTVPAVNREHAREEGVRAAHRQVGVPPWLPLQRISLEHATAEPVIAEAAQASIFEVAA